MKHKGVWGSGRQHPHVVICITYCDYSQLVVSAAVKLGGKNLQVMYWRESHTEFESSGIKNSQPFLESKPCPLRLYSRDNTFAN